METNYIPHDIVTEAIGQCDFTGKDEDIEIAEQIASNSYTSMEDLISTMDAYVLGPKRKKAWDKTKEQMKTSPYFKTHFKQP